MFASKSERKVHYSIRKFSIGVASVVVASLFLGGVVHAEEVRRGNNLTVTSSGDEVESHYQSILEKVRKSLEKDRHTQNVDLIKKLQDIKRTYLYSLKEKPEAELTSKTKKELTAAFEQFKKDTLKSGKKVAEAEKKAKAQKEEDRRNYPTNTYKTIELEIAEAEVGVAKAELELEFAQAQVQIPQDTEKINAAKSKVEAAKSNVKKLEKIKSDIEKTYLSKLDNSTKETPKPRVRRNSPEIKAKGRVKNYEEANIELSKYMTDLYKLDNSTKETPKSRVRRNSPQVGDSRELKETIDKAKETLSTYMVTRLTKLDPSVFWFADLLMDAKKVVEEYKTKLEDASDKKSVEDLRKEAEGKIESLIVTHQNREKENQPAPQPGGQAGGSMVVPPVTQTPPSTSQSPGQKATEAEKKKLQDLIRQFQEALNKLDDETKTVPDGAKLTGEAGKAYNETRTYAKEVVDKSKKLLSQTAVTMDELAMQLTKLNDAMSKLKEAKAKLVPEVKPQPENPEPKPQPEGEKPSVPDINQEKEKAKLAIATYMSKILDDIKKHHLKKEKHHQIVALIKDLDKLKKQALSEIDNVNTKVEIENTVHKVFADMDTVVTKFQKGLIQNTPQVPEAPKSPEVPKVSDTPKAPDTPQVPEAPKAPDTPQIPEAPAPETPKTGWKQENGMWYFYNTDGSMATGWLEYNGSWYYLNANGAMATGWLEYNGSWYYLNTNGAMETGWLEYNGSWYYLNTNGAMETGWLEYNGSWYYLNANGSMATGWLKDGDTWYYLEASGAMKESQWFKVSDKWYYVNGSGALAVNTTVGGYRVNANGKWVN
ncbi:pneumococcal surface protein PspC, choline-binding form [Streptococcus pneumoniae]|uniref:pneumococcal surface protein PspC, choline-binding form n=1 Tax=Streptococcus pneumoniae TaxID=1313 RepID=UPI0005DE5048|nr:pneumococcal surface protein PspC, choline-binding form [Streptococcus pneumoniae]CJT38609.1 choline-binding surface protein A [Streptococcus pneumoniae]CKB57086.1 choline-binding surface protein A [Streptococcus pneumoniae]CKC06871.1 choline-binding surface protein A [Streptococcus pneumoniae]COQ17428.1 choline-binding surface protein A [Streptococcus pneumoniae]VNY36916.1 choline-binding surface protein A [Streptococcus pneumoniae]